MKKTLKSLILSLVFVIGLSSCFTLEHTVGNGAQTGVEDTQRQWYVLWGLVPLNDVDTKAMAGGASDYTIKSERTFLDSVIGIFTGFVTIYPQSVTVTK